MYVRELRVAYRRRRVHKSADIPDGPLSTPAECAPIILRLLQHESVEVLLALYLSTRHEMLCFQGLSRGSLDAAVVHPREVFKGAYLANAAAIILAHNHPSGDPTPSRDDMALTRRLMTAGDLLGIDILDHIIVAPFDRYSSLKEQGRI